MKSKDFYNTPAWKNYSKWRKLSLCNNDYVCQCSTCGRFLQLPDKNIHLGHWIKVFDCNNTYFSVAFEDTNNDIMCLQCNHFAGGRQDIMKEFLIKKHGIKEIERLEIKKHNICKLDKFELSLLSDIYKKKFNDLVKIKDNPWKK